MVKNNNIGIYLDFDNIWGGILRKLEIDAKDRQEHSISLHPIEVKVFKDILSSLGKFLYWGLKLKFSSYSDEYGSDVYAKVRYIKAFAVFSKLPFANKIGDVQTILHNSGIEPISSFIAKEVKDASDRVLILEVIEDIFFNKLPIDTVIIGSGDIDFYPFVSFFYEHSDKELYLLSFKEEVSSLYKQIPLTSQKVLPMEDLEVGDSLSFKDFLKEKKEELSRGITSELERFKKLFISKFLEEERERQEIKTGLVVRWWRKEWLKQGINFSSEEINYFLYLLKKGKIIDIEKEGAPLRGKIKKAENWPSF